MVNVGGAMTPPNSAASGELGSVYAGFSSPIALANIKMWVDSTGNRSTAIGFLLYLTLVSECESNQA